MTGLPGKTEIPASSSLGATLPGEQGGPNVTPGLAAVATSVSQLVWFVRSSLKDNRNVGRLDFMDHSYPALAFSSLLTAVLGLNLP